MPTAIESPVFCDEAQKRNKKKENYTAHVLLRCWGEAELRNASIKHNYLLKPFWTDSEHPIVPTIGCSQLHSSQTTSYLTHFFFKLTSFTNCFAKQAGLWGEWLSNYQKQIQQTHTVAFCPRHQPALGSLETFSLRVFSLQNLRLCSLHTSGMIQHLQN